MTSGAGPPRGPAAAHTNVVYDDAVEQPSGPVLRADEVSWAGVTLERLSEAFGGKVVGQEQAPREHCWSGC